MQQISADHENHEHLRSVIGFNVNKIELCIFEAA
jgi:hypothetical protein